MGSGISLNTFVDRAKLSEGGDMRLSRDGGELVNKGTLGQKVATFFTDIGKALGLVKETKGNEASDRQEKALAGFREALSRDFTPEIAEKVLTGVTKFTGKVVLDTVNRAANQKSTIEYHNARFNPELSPHDVKQNLGVDLKELSERQRGDFVRHFNRAKDDALEGGLRTLDFDEAKKMAGDALQKTLTMPVMRNPTPREDRGLESIMPHVTRIREAVTNDLKAAGRKPDHLLELIEQKVSAMVKDTLALPKGEGPEAFHKVHDQVTSDVRDLLAWAGRSDQKSYVNISQQTQAQVVQYVSHAMHQLLKM
jgi:hypothetical protein